MKKIVLALAVVFSVAMVSCSGNKAAENVDTDTAVVVEEAAVVEETVVTDSNDSNVAAATEAPAEEAPATEAAAK